MIRLKNISFDDVERREIWHPGQLYKKELVEIAYDAWRKDLDYFDVPAWIYDRTDMKRHQAAMAYKAGFLYEFLKAIHPDWTFKEIAEHLFAKYHVFLSERNLQNYLKRWRDHRNQFLKENVPSQNKS